jgi:inward rectifier potassium channel
VIFANAPVVGIHDGKQTLMLRMANHRYNMIAGATAKLWLARMEKTQEGASLRRVRELKLERSENPMFAMSWTIFHVIDESSALFGVDAEMLEASDAGFVVTFDGLDESSGQSLHARRLYRFSDLRWGHQYVDILSSDGDRSHIDYTRFHDTRAEAS